MSSMPAEVNEALNYRKPGAANIADTMNWYLRQPNVALFRLFFMIANSPVELEKEHWAGLADVVEEVILELASRGFDPYMKDGHPVIALAQGAKYVPTATGVTIAFGREFDA